MFERCKKADILEKSGELLCKARVKVGRSGDIMMIIPTAVWYKPNGMYHVIFYDPVSGLVTCKCRLSASVTLPGGELCSLRCEVQNRLAARQRRQDVKVPVQIPVMIRSNFLPGDVVQIPEMGLPATIDNISAGGIYFHMGTALSVGRRVWFTMRQVGEEITLSAQILRVERLNIPQGHGEMYGYGCKFINLLSRQETLLRSFVFQEERRQRLDLQR